MRPGRLKSVKVRAASDRGAATRQRLLEVAIRVFATRGFDGARTRDIAEAARTNVVSILYYFGNKEGLYKAAAFQVATRLASHQEPFVQRARASMSRPGIKRPEVIGVLSDLMCDFVRLVLGDFLPDYYGRFANQVVYGPIHALHVIDRVLAPLRVTVAEAIAILTGESATCQATQVRALSMIGSCSVFRRGRYTVLQGLRRKQIGPRELKVIEQGIRANIKAMFS